MRSHKIQYATSRNLDMYRNSVSVIQAAVMYSNPVSVLLKQLHPEFPHNSSPLISLDTIVPNNGTTPDILFLNYFPHLKSDKLDNRQKSNNSIHLGELQNGE